MARKKPSLLTLVCPVKRVRFTMAGLQCFDTTEHATVSTEHHYYRGIISAF